MKTRSEALQAQLEAWVAQTTTALSFPDPSRERSEAIFQFVQTFTPKDVTPDDIDHFSQELTKDDEFFRSIHRDLAQCASGEGVESIEGNQRTKATFTMIPPTGILTEGSSLDLVREVTFISTDGGTTWTAEG